MKYKHILLLMTLIFLLGTARTLRAQDQALKIVTTTTQVTDAATIIAGDLLGETIQITGLMGAGVDPHLYQPTESDINALTSADLIVYSGLNLEGQFGTVFESLGQQGKRIYRMSDPVKIAGYIIGGFDLSEEFQNVDDPHFWFDPRNWQMSVLGLAEVIADMDPDNAQTYMTNARVYSEKLDALYQWSLEAMSTVPEDRRVLVTSHDAFQYFGDAFGWGVRGLQGISTQDEAGVADVQEIARFVIDNRIPVMFVESSVSPNAIEAVQEAVAAGGYDVSIGIRELYSDAMGNAGSFGGTYIGMIAENVLTILQSYQLQGVDLIIPEFVAAELGIELPEELTAIEAEQGEQ